MSFSTGDGVYIDCIGQYYGRRGTVIGRRPDGAYVVALEWEDSGPVCEIFAEEHLIPTLSNLPDGKAAGDALRRIMVGVDTFPNLEDAMKEVSKLMDSEKTMCEYHKPCIYQKAIEGLFDRQFRKGIEKYGVSLEENDTLTTEQRVDHLEEELADGMVYCEHLKAALKSLGIMANDYQRAALRTAQVDAMSADELLLNGVMGLCGEAGECIDLVKKTRFQGHELDKDKLKKELGDVAWYLAVASRASGFDLSEVLEENIRKLKERYPDGFDKARSINRKENKTEEETSNLFDGD